MNTTSSHIRQNEHLAVLLPRNLWKRDSLSARCDTFACSAVFSNIPSISSLSSLSLSNFNLARTERRHHCRKCGGVFCSACSSRTTPLLDIRNLPFLNPPRGTSIYDWVQTESQVEENARVCDDCWDQLHGVASYGNTCPPSSPTSSTSSLSPATPALTLSTLSTLLPVSGDTSPASSTSPRTPPDTPLLTLTSSASSLPSLATLGPSLSKRTRATSSTSSTSTPVSRRSSVISRTSNPDLRRRATLQAASNHKEETPLPVGELRSYPLCRASTLCKASGGGRWTPGPELAREEERVFMDYSDYSPLSASPTSDNGIYTPYTSYSLFTPSKPSSPTHSSARRRSSRSNPAPTLGIGKPLWQVEWETEVRRAERRRDNPVVRTGPNGEFCVRVYSNSSKERMARCEDDLDERPATIARSFSLSTF